MSLKILYISMDEGLVAHSRADAINKHTGSEARVFDCPMYRSEEEKQRFHDSGEFDKASAELDELVRRWADVVHVCNTFPWTWHIDSLDYTVFEFYGGMTRMYSSALWDWQRTTMRPVIASPELGRFLPRFHYLPIPMDVHGAKLPKKWFVPHSPLRVIQTPTRRDYKNTDVLIEAARRLEGVVDLVLVEGEPPGVALREKGACDVYFGSMCVGDFGQSEREAMAMGLGVVARLQPLVRVYNPGCPVVGVSSLDELVGVLGSLAGDGDACTALKVRSRQWAEEFFDASVVAPRMEAFYEYVVSGDPGFDEWYAPYAEIWMDVAKREHGMERFVNIQGVRW